MLKNVWRKKKKHLARVAKAVADADAWMSGGA